MTKIDGATIDDGEDLDLVILIYILIEYSYIEYRIQYILSKGFERSVCWNEYKAKVRIKLRKMNIDIFSTQILLELIDHFFQFIQI